MNNRGGQDEANAILLVIALVAIVVGLIIQIFYLLTLSKCLSRVDSRNRDMEPGMVWLNLVPCLNLVWIFLTVNRIGSSQRKEFRDRGLYGDDETFGANLGITYNILVWLGAIPFIGFLFSIGSLICWIMYWVKIANFSAQIAEPNDRARRFDDDGFDDIRPRKRGDDEHDRYRRDDGEPDDRYRA